MYIYKLTSSQTDQVYVGKTKKKINYRLTEHIRDYNKWLNDEIYFCSSYFLTEYDDVKIELIEETNNSLREGYWIQKLNCCNFQFNGPNFLIHKTKDKKCKLGFVYTFEIRRNKKRIVEKKSVNKEFIIIYIQNFN